MFSQYPNPSCFQAHTLEAVMLCVSKKFMYSGCVYTIKNTYVYRLYCYGNMPKYDNISREMYFFARETIRTLEGRNKNCSRTGRLVRARKCAISSRMKEVINISRRREYTCRRRRRRPCNPSRSHASAWRLWRGKRNHTAFAAYRGILIIDSSCSLRVPLPTPLPACLPTQQRRSLVRSRYNRQIKVDGR